MHAQAPLKKNLSQRKTVREKQMDVICVIKTDNGKGIDFLGWAETYTVLLK